MAHRDHVRPDIALGNLGGRCLKVNLASPPGPAALHPHLLQGPRHLTIDVYACSLAPCRCNRFRVIAPLGGRPPVPLPPSTKRCSRGPAYTPHSSAHCTSSRRLRI